MKDKEIIPNLFRTEYSKITAVLSKRFGFQHIELAEDIASETFLTAAETWTYNGIPENPVAWLYTVAKNKARNYLKHQSVFRDKVSGIINSEIQQKETEIDLSEKNISDSQLQMLFAVCHPSISAESQIALALRVLCGFGIDEIADAFLTGKETIKKRLLRAKAKLRHEKIQIELPDENEIKTRLETVLTTLYLLFNEGYYSESKNEIIRKDFCLEAMRLNYLLIENETTNTHAVNSLLSLMCFHASRLDARSKLNGEIILYEDQDTSLWNTELIEKGFYFLQRASKWEITSKYYIEASIAYWHTVKSDSAEKWNSILKLYEVLLQIEYFPVADMNRIYALSKVKGDKAALKEALKLEMKENHFYNILLAELFKSTNKKMAADYLLNAQNSSKSEYEKKLIQQKILSL